MLSTASAGAIVPGNHGYIRRSQFQHDGFGELGLQWREVSVGGPVSIREVRNGGASPPPSLPGSASNTGNILDSQFNPKGFSHVGSQLRRVDVRGGVAIDVFDDTPAEAGAGGGLLGSPTNSGDVEHSQFNDSGFGAVGLQWLHARLGGDLLVGTRTSFTPVGGAAGAEAPSLSDGRGPASTNTGLIRDSQFNDGGFGDVGLQFRGVRVKGSVGVSMVRRLYESPQASAVGASPSGGLGRGSADATNTGVIRDSQFSDGGFGDVGFQWWNVAVGRSVATSTNILNVQPRSDGDGPIDVGGIVFASEWPTPDSGSYVGGSVGTGAVGLAATAGPGGVAAGATTDATNSGLVRKTQFSDGGFGDVGLQWRDVRIGGGVGVVHNSLSIQPENAGQGLITVRDVAFPSDPSPMPAPRTGPGGRLAPTPPIIVQDGSRVTSPLPRRTRPFDRDLESDSATNSGNVVGSQFSDGGFGDVGMQWRDVDVRGDVRIIHNSLSVHPEGSNLAGVVVANVAFGRPGAAGATTVAQTSAGRDDGDRSGPGNDRILLYRQFTDSTQADVFLQWDGVARGYGVVIVNNVIQVDSNATVTLEDVTFPEETAPGRSAAVAPRLAEAGRRILGAATNSGIIRGGQFSDGGFGDVGLQWRNVRVDGTVAVVHNTLSVDVTGSGVGPIAISNVVFASGALDPATTAGPGSRTRSGRASESGDHATNGGIIVGGQFAAGGLGHIFTQWRGVRIRGPVTILDNVLSVEVADPAAGPITISHVRYG